jgi:hypothetical protein
VGAVWAALRSGIEGEMPVTHLSVRLAHAVFGYGYISTRLPAMVGFWVMLLGLYVFLRRRVPLPYALIGMMIPMMTFAWRYASEARAYGVLLGSTMVALVAWQNVDMGRLRGLSLVGISVSLIVLLASNSMGLVVAMPFALGEVVRTLDRRRLDLPVWLAFAAAIPVVALYPIILGALSSGVDWSGSRPHLARLPEFYAEALKSAITPLLVAGIAAFLLGRGREGDDSGKSVLPRHEAVAMLCLVLAPVPFFVGALLSKHVIFYPRYGMLSVIGVAGWAAVLLYRAARGNRRTGMIMAAVILAWLVLARGRAAFAQTHDPAGLFWDEHRLLLRTLSDGRPVAVTDNVLFLALDFYLPNDLRPRLYYVQADRDVATRYVGQQLADEVMQRNIKVLPIHTPVQHWSEFAQRNPRFLLLYNNTPLKWPLDQMPKQGWRLTFKSQESMETIYEVSREPDGSSR